MTLKHEGTKHIEAHKAVLFRTNFVAFDLFVPFVFESVNG